jgi:hypothetical protein
MRRRRRYRLGSLPARGGRASSYAPPLPAVICHRGGEASAPENTLPAFEASALAAAESVAASHAAGTPELECARLSICLLVLTAIYLYCFPDFRERHASRWWVETDLRSTVEGELVLMHDARVDRTTSDGSGPCVTGSHSTRVVNRAIPHSVCAINADIVVAVVELWMHVTGCAS